MKRTGVPRSRAHDRARRATAAGSCRPSALAIHLCIGQAYALSVFNLPMSRLIGITETAPGDWPLTTTVWIFNIAIVFLGLSAAVFGTWVERVGPRKAMFASACCFSAGFLISAVGVFAASDRARLSGLRRARRHRSRPRLHLAGLDADQVVSRSSGHGDRHGHHGLWRRRDDRRAARREPDALLQLDRPRSASGRRSSPWGWSISR